MVKKRVINKDNSKQEHLLQFLKLTKNGKYAPVEKTSLQYTRMKEERINVDLADDDQYYYSLS